MFSLKIKDIEIKYDANCNSELLHVTDMIRNNYQLFLRLIDNSEFEAFSLIPTTDEKVMYIEDFDELFYYLVDCSYNRKPFQDSIYGEGLLSSIYIEFLARKSQNNNILVEEIEEQYLFDFLAYRYFMRNNDFDSFVDYLKSRDEVVKFQMIMWLSREARYDSYNNLMRNFVDEFTENEALYFKQITNYFESLLLRDEEKEFSHDFNENSCFSFDELDKLFISFLESINAPDNWFLLYKKLKNNNSISFVEDRFESKCISEDGEIKIVISREDTINSFYYFVHEFMHAVAFREETVYTSIFMVELSSILFEKLACEFLKNKIGGNTLVTKFNSIRDVNNINIYNDMRTIINDMSYLISNDYLDRNTAIRRMKKRNEILLLGDDCDDLIGDFVDKSCDDFIVDCVEVGFKVIKGFEYLAGTYLADRILEKLENNEDCLSRMIDIADDIYSFSFDDIVNIFELNDNNKVLIYS